MYKSTHKCGNLELEDLGSQVFLNGWINSIRLHGRIVFIDLRDRYGLVQLVYDSTLISENFEFVKKFSMEDVLSIRGSVRKREVPAKNKSLKTRNIEILIENYKVLNKAETLPFILSDRSSSEEDLRLKYRYLELRMKSCKKISY